MVHCVIRACPLADDCSLALGGAARLSQVVLVKLLVLRVSMSTRALAWGPAFAVVDQGENFCQSFTKFWQRNNNKDDSQSIPDKKY